MTVGIPANMMILFVTTFDTKTKKTPSTIFMNNFAIADLVMLLFRSISVDFRLKQFPFQWDYGKLLCFMESTLELVVSVVSVSMIMLMALDRYGAIKSYKYMQVSPYFLRLSRYRPLQASSRTSSFYYTWLVALIVWVFAFCLANPLWARFIHICAIHRISELQAELCHKLWPITKLINFTDTNTLQDRARF